MDDRGVVATAETIADHGERGVGVAAAEIHRQLARQRDRAERAVTIESIQKMVCDFFHIRPTELRSKKRTRTVALPRQLAMYLCRRYTDASFPVIGDRFGGRDHSTVIHAAQVIERRLREDPTFRATVERLERLLERPC